MVHCRSLAPQASLGDYCRLNGGHSVPQNPSFLIKRLGVIFTDWREKSEQLKFDLGKSWREVANEIKSSYFPNLPYEKVIEKVRAHIRSTDRYKANKSDSVILPDADSKRPVGIFSDPHIPFDHPNYLRFVQDTFKKYNVGQIVCLGDLVDHHAISRFQSEPCAKGAYDELDMSIERVEKYVKAFPKLKMCRGNHDAIPVRQAATVGIGERYLKSFSELLGLPKTWEIEDEFIIDNVLYKHGINCLGKDGALNTAIQERMSTVIGHSHSFGGVKYSANKRNIIFGMNAGCGIDISKYAFAYGKYDKNRPTLGCGIVFNDSNAIFVPMGSEYFRST